MTKLLVLDTETGGLTAGQHSLLSIGAVVWEDGRIKDTSEILVAEQTYTVTSEALTVNKIDLANHHAYGLAPAEAVRVLFDFVRINFENRPAVVVGHNVSFDLGFIKHLWTRTGRSNEFSNSFSHRTLDTAGILRFLAIAGKVPPEAASLDSAIKHFELENPSRHTALGDALVTAKLLTRLVKLIG